MLLLVLFPLVVVVVVVVVVPCDNRDLQNRVATLTTSLVRYIPHCFWVCAVRQVNSVTHHLPSVRLEGVGVGVI